MQLSKRWVLVVGIFGSLYLVNASWLAAPTRGVPRVIAQRGVAQHYSSSTATADTCTAKLILPPSHPFIDNTLPSIDAALAAGADVVEVDLRITRDRQFVLFHDAELGCRTEGSGRVAAHTASELQALDVGYGYTADDGKTFPLRGKGIGLMPTLAEVLHEYPQQHFLVQIKDGAPGVANALVTYLRANQLDPSQERLSFFGAIAPLRRLREIIPTAHTWSDRTVERCLTGYLETGWFGHVSRACDDGMIIVPVEQAWLLWGWPNRFLARMRQHHTDVMLVGRIDGLASWQRLDTIAELARIPAGFDGWIWTDQIRVIGPVVRLRRKDR